jgi:hypothetical protein
MSMRSLVLVAFVFFAVTLSAQDFEFPRGVYMTYNELMDRKPSKDCEFSVTEKTNVAIRLIGGGRYSMETTKRCLKSKKVKNEVFAYSSGDSLFINSKLITGSPGYVLVTEFGRFLLFKSGLAQFGKMNDIQMGNIPYMSLDGKIKKTTNIIVGEGAVGGAVGGLVSGIINSGLEGTLYNYNIPNIRFYYVIDQKENKIKTLSRNVMKSFLDDYPELLKEYNKIELKHDKNVYLKYIQLMNEADTGKY